MTSKIFKLIKPISLVFVGCANCYAISDTDEVWLDISTAYEIIYVKDSMINPHIPVTTYKSGGENPITSDEWAAYTPPNGYTKNSTRNLQFNQQIFIASPDEPDGTINYISTSDGYTWGTMSKAISAMWPYNPGDYGSDIRGAFDAADKILVPPPGVVKVTANYKNQKMKFFATEGDVPLSDPSAKKLTRYFITDQWGNQYIMHASQYENEADITAAFELAVLPVGWTKQIKYLENDLIISPAKGGTSSEYLILKDSSDNTYHQITWSPAGTNIAAQIQSPGMEIWGGLTDDRLIVTNSWNNVIYGGGGADLFVFNITDGMQQVMDFNPDSGDKLSFNGRSYSTMNTANGMMITLSGGGIVLLYNVHDFSNSWVQ